MGIYGNIVIQLHKYIYTYNQRGFSENIILGQSTGWVETNPVVFWYGIFYVHQLSVFSAKYLRLAIKNNVDVWSIKIGHRRVDGVSHNFIVLGDRQLKFWKHIEYIIGI